jgi:urea carboxylase-associated protein 2
MPAPASSLPPIADDRLLFQQDLPGGAMWSHVLRRHHTLRLTDLEGGANVGVLLYNSDQLLERYNMPDTLKAQHTAFITRGRALYSDMGRVLCSVSEDTAGWHDTVCGHLDARGSDAKYGVARYQERRNEYHRNAHDAFLVELGKWGLGKADLVPNLNLFSKVVADGEGKLRFVPGASRPGSFVDLRAEMNVLVVLNTCPHPFDPAPAYAPRPVSLQLYRSDPPGPDDLTRRSRPENERGFANTERYFL